MWLTALIGFLLQNSELFVTIPSYDSEVLFGPFDRSPEIAKYCFKKYFAREISSAYAEAMQRNTFKLPAHIEKGLTSSGFDDALTSEAISEERGRLRQSKMTLDEVEYQQRALEFTGYSRPFDPVTRSYGRRPQPGTTRSDSSSGDGPI